jgi:hypothetical protein
MTIDPINLLNMWKLNPYIRQYDDKTTYSWNYWFLLDDYYNKVKYEKEKRNDR